MQGPISLGEFEQVVLLAILRLGEQAYGVTIREEIQRARSAIRRPGTLYTTLDRLEEKGLVTSRFGIRHPSEAAGPTIFFRRSAIGIEAVTSAQTPFNGCEGTTAPGEANA